MKYPNGTEKPLAYEKLPAAVKAKVGDKRAAFSAECQVIRDNDGDKFSGIAKACDAAAKVVAKNGDLSKVDDFEDGEWEALQQALQLLHSA